MFFYWLYQHLCATCVSGDAHLAKIVKNKVFSFDLISNDPSVIACDMSNVSVFFFSFKAHMTAIIVIWTVYQFIKYILITFPYLGLNESKLSFSYC